MKKAPRSFIQGWTNAPPRKAWKEHCRAVGWTMPFKLFKKLMKRASTNIK